MADRDTLPGQTVSDDLRAFMLILEDHTRDERERDEMLLSAVNDARREVRELRAHVEDQMRVQRERDNVQDSFIRDLVRDTRARAYSADWKSIAAIAVAVVGGVVTIVTGGGCTLQ